MKNEDHEGDGTKPQKKGTRQRAGSAPSKRENVPNQRDTGAQPGEVKGIIAGGTEFKFQGKWKVRTISKDGHVWFVTSDVCTILDVGNPSDVAARLDDEEKGLDIVETPGGNQEMNLINESGLYAVILTSRKPEARTFRRWVTGDVIPAIRKTGRYETGSPEVPKPHPLDPIRLPGYGRYVILALPDGTKIQQTEMDEIFKEDVHRDCEIMSCDLITIASFWEKLRLLVEVEDLAIDSVAWAGVDRAIKIGEEHGKTFLDLTFQRQARLNKRLNDQLRKASGKTDPEPLTADAIRPPKSQRH